MPLPFVTIRGIKIAPPRTFLSFGLALMLLALPAQAKSKKASPTPSSVPPTSPMLDVPGSDPNSPNNGPGGLINSEMSGRDLEFLTKVVNTGREQVYYIGLLRSRASSDEIKKLAATLASAQDEENTHLVKLAAKKGWNLSMEPTDALKKTGDQLSKLEGSNFDQAAMAKLLTANRDSMKAYQSADESSDKDIKSFAVQMLPFVEDKGHILSKMTGAGSKTAAQLFRHSAAPGDSVAPPSAAQATPAPDKSTPKSGTRSKSPPTPKPVPTPTPPASSIPIATPPGQPTSRPPQPAIIPSKSATPSSPAPIPPPIGTPSTTP